VDDEDLQMIRDTIEALQDEQRAQEDKAFNASKPRRSRPAQKRWADANRDAIKSAQFKANLARRGLTLDCYHRMLAAQGNACAICRQTCVSGRRLQVDHCHLSGAVRGLLCINCNTALGKFKDLEQNLRAAIEYLAKARLAPTDQVE
jgi:hypothetical protein